MPKLTLPKYSPENHASVFFFSICGILFMTLGVYIPYLTAHYASLGIDSSQIGILASAGPVATIFILPIWSRVSDITGNRRGVLKVIALGACFSILLFIFSNSFWTLLLTVFIFFCFSSSLMPLLDAVIISYTTKHNIKFSRVRLGGTVGYGLIVIFSGYIYSYSSTLTFILSSVLFFVLYLLARKIPQVDVQKKERRKFQFRRIFKNKQIIFIFCLAFVIQIAMSFYFSFIGVYIHQLGFSSGQIGLSTFIASIGEVPVLLLIDRVLRKYSVPTVAVCGGIFLSIRLLLLYFAQGMGLVYLSQAGNGLAFILVYYSCATFINKEMEDDLKSTGQSMLAFFQMGLGSIVGNVLGGYISSRFSLRQTYLYYGTGLGIVCVICAIGIFVIYMRKRIAAKKIPAYS